MSVEGSLVRPESATGPREKEQGSDSKTEGIPEWSVNVQTYELLKEGRCTYNAEEQSLVWPPMLLMCSVAIKPLGDDLKWLRNMLAIEGVQANNVAETKHVCCEGIRSYHLFVLPSNGLSFATAKAMDSACGLDFHVFYPSWKDMIDIKNGRVPEFSRRVVEGLKYHGMPRQAWMNLGVDLVRDDGICVGRGVCQKHEAIDSVDEKPLGEFHVGVRVLEVLDDLLPSHWKGSLRLWRTTRVLHNGVSLFECLRQHMEDESEHFYYTDGSASATIAQAEGVLRDQSLSSVAPLVGTCKDWDVNFDHLSPTCSKTCQDAIDIIEKSTVKSDSAALSLHDGKSFATKYDSDESLRKDDIEIVLNDASKERNLMEVLGTTNSFQLARDAAKRLTVLQKLTDPGCSSTAISSMIREVELRELSTLGSIGQNVKREERNKMAIASFGSEIERFILRRRKEQHENLLEEIASIKTKHTSTLEAFVLDKFEFVDDIGRRRKETKGMHEWLSHYTAKATDKEKTKWEEQVAEARLEEQKKWQEEVAKARNEEQRKWELAKAWAEEQKRCQEIILARVRTELAVARQELADQKEAMPKCAICFEGLEVGIVAKCGEKRSRNDVVLKKRGCFTPCMHTSMCLCCAVGAWRRFKRCPVCSTPCFREPYSIFL